MNPKMAEKLRAMMHASSINGWLEFINATFPDLEAAAEKGFSAFTKTCSTCLLTKQEELEIRETIFETHGLNVEFIRPENRSYVDAVTISWEEK